MEKLNVRGLGHLQSVLDHLKNHTYTLGQYTLHSMYSDDKSSVKIENMLTPAFRCHTGVKQGCMLSPTLFNLYLSDLSEKLKAKNLNDVELNELPLSCMLYADDLVIFSKSKNGLQDYLDSLSEYCTENDLSVNFNKTKVLIFNNCGRTMNKHVLYIEAVNLTMLAITNILAYSLVLMGPSHTLNRK